MNGAPRPTLLVVGGTLGLLGRSLLPEVAGDFRVRSLHRSPAPAERDAGLETIAAEIGGPVDLGSALSGVDAIVNLAWHRAGPRERFERLADGLLELIEAARAASVRRFVHVSVPDAPPDLESGLPYLVQKRRVDRALAASGLSYAILRPSALFGPGDVLLGVMLRTIRWAPVFPMFGDGAYRISPIAARDVCAILRRLLAPSAPSGTLDAGGPVAYRYRELTDLLFATLGRRPRYWQLSPTGSRRLARWMERLGSTRLYEYEVEWLLSDRLGLPPFEGLGRPLERVEGYLAAEAARLLGRPAPGPSR